jgi:predicted dehydrogenase
MTNIKICVVGGGSWGKNHISTLFKLGSLHGIVDKNKDLIKNYKKIYKNINLHISLAEALKYKYDGYIVATPANTHFKIAEKIIKSNTHVLVEKPLTLNIKDCEKLISLALKYKVNLMVGHVLLFHPAINKIKHLIKTGKIGSLQYLYSNRLNLGKVRTEENVFWSFAPHDISIFKYLIESDPIKISSHGSSFIQKDIHDSTLTHFKYKNGVNGHIHVSWLHPFKEHRLVVVGSEGMISFEDSSNDKKINYYPKKIGLINGVLKKIDKPKESIPFKEKLPLEIELEYFIDHINRNKIIKISDGQSGLEVVKILVESSKQLSANK